MARNKSKKGPDLPKPLKDVAKHVPTGRDRGPDHEPNVETAAEDLALVGAHRRLKEWSIKPPRNTSIIEMTRKPPTVRILPPKPFGESDRDEPPLLRGRETEFTLLANRITHMPHPIIAIEGPAGVGKSTLLSAARTYARHQGYVSLSIDCEHISNPEKFIRGVRQNLEHQLQLGLRNTSTAPTGLRDAIQNFGQYQWEDLTPEIICRQILGLAQESGFHGVLITIDECQKWLNLYPTKESAQGFPAELLRFLNDTIGKHDQKMPMLCLLAGIHGTIDATVRILSPRFAKQSNIMLGDMRDEAIAQTINDRLNFLTASGHLPATPSPELLHYLIDKIQGHPAHVTTQTSAILPYAIEQSEKGNSQLELTHELQTHIEQQQNEYYSDRRRAVERVQPENPHLLLTFAYLQHRAGGPLGRDTLKKIIRKQLNFPESTPEQTITENIDQQIKYLCRQNILTHIGDNDESQTTAYYVTPTPTFTTYLVNKLAQTKESQEEHQAYQQQAVHLMPEIPEPVTLYTPTDKPPIHEYEPIRPTPARGADQTNALQPLLECDEEGTRVTLADISTLWHTLNKDRVEANMKPLTNPPGPVPPAPPSQTVPKQKTATPQNNATKAAQPSENSTLTTNEFSSV